MSKGLWSRRADQEQRELYKDLDTVADITKKRLERTGHLVRMDHGRIIKTIFESKREGRRRRIVRRRLRWLEDTEKDLLEIMTEDIGQS
jgi:hypothetical protein